MNRTTDTLAPRGLLPGDRLVLRSLARARAQRYYVYLPPQDAAPDRLLVAVHGIARDAREQALEWLPVARSFGCALVAPLFDRTLTPGYQRLGWDTVGVRSDRTLDAIVAEVQAERGSASPYARLTLAGYSGGAQFCHRYALAYSHRVSALICGAAGWYTWPDDSLPWPLGTGSGAPHPHERASLDGLLGVPTFVYVGEADVDGGASLRSSPELNALQGTTRRARAERWVYALARAATARSLPPRAVLHTLPGVAHDFAAAARAGAIEAAAAWLRSLHEHDPRGAAASDLQGDRHERN